MITKLAEEPLETQNMRDFFPLPCVVMLGLARARATEAFPVKGKALAKLASSSCWDCWVSDHLLENIGLQTMSAVHVAGTLLDYWC